ncbi:hypothetical protein HMPREF9404_5685 [Eggerthella sp. HGA1]|nr:hypothetical protein HMPREF9404_5685 [Eggerthella sp. HGA1]
MRHRSSILAGGRSTATSIYEHARARALRVEHTSHLPGETRRHRVFFTRKVASEVRASCVECRA